MRPSSVLSSSTILELLYISEMVIHFMQWREVNHRPMGITIVVILQIIAGITSIIGSIIYLTNSAADEDNYGFVYLFLTIVLGIFYLYVAYGLYTGKGWAWTYVIIVQIIGIPLSLIVFFAGQSDGLPGDLTGFGLVSVPLSIIIVLYMLKSTTRAYFGKAKLSA